MYRFQSNRLATSTDRVLLSLLKWPVETIYLGLRPAVNVASTNTNQYRDWHNLTLLTDRVVDINAKSRSEVMIDDTVVYSSTGLKHKNSFSQECVERVTYAQVTETIDTLELQAHGINIFAQYKAQFFRDYMSFTFGGHNINTPDDQGAMMINFCLYPGTYQPSGHINVSRTREFYINYASSYVTSSTPADMLTVAVALNFLLISDGSAVLRYST